MSDPGVTRVAVYIDFDNIVISRYDQVHGRSQFQRDKVRGFDGTPADAELTAKLRARHGGRRRRSSTSRPRSAPSS